MTSGLEKWTLQDGFNEAPKPDGESVWVRNAPTALQGHQVDGDELGHSMEDLILLVLGQVLSVFCWC